MKNKKNMLFINLFINNTNQSGVALLIVIGAITLLSFLMATLSLDVNTNKLRLYNQHDQTKARLNAEAGLNFAMAKLHLYQAAINIIETKEQLKKTLPTYQLENIISEPFVFPIPNIISKKANLIQKNAIKDFSDNILLDGNVQVNIKAVSGFLNPNNLRIIKNIKEEEEEDSEEKEEEKKPPYYYIEKELLSTLKRAIDIKKEEDDIFDTSHPNLNPELLIKEIKYYVSSPEEFEDSEKSEIQSLYSEKNVTPKHAPLTSVSELYLLQGWDDSIIDLIKDRLTIHSVTIIPVNKITANQLRILFPDITKDQVEEFFNYRDGDKENELDPHPFKNVEEFKELIVSRIALVDEENYTKRLKDFSNAGIKLGAAGKLFKVTSKGSYRQSTYTLSAYIDLPIKPTPIKKKKNKSTENKESENEESENENSSETEADKKETKKEKPAPLQLLRPRIVELYRGS